MQYRVRDVVLVEVAIEEEVGVGSVDLCVQVRVVLEVALDASPSPRGVVRLRMSDPRFF